MCVLPRVLEDEKPRILRARSSGRIVIKDAAVMATPGSTSVQTRAGVAVSVVGGISLVLDLVRWVAY